jgi:hypothetical protein
MWEPTPAEYGKAIDAMLAYEASRGVRVTGMILTKRGLELVRRSRRTRWKCGDHDVTVLDRYLYHDDIDRVLIEGRQGGRRLARRMAYAIPSDVDRDVYAMLRVKSPEGLKGQNKTLDAVRKLARLERPRDPSPDRDS